MINLNTEAAKSRYHREYILSTMQLERYAMNSIAPILGRCFLDAARLLEFGITNFDSVILNNKSRLVKALFNIYRRTGVVFSDKAFDAFEDVFGKTYAEVPLTRGMKEDYWGTYGIWAKKTAAKKIVSINDTTRENIRVILEKGRADGKSYGMIAKDMRNVSPLVNKQRAYKIARTEIHTASVKSMDESFGHTGVEFEREWRSTIDMRTRGLKIGETFNHILANGERTSQDGKFIRTGEALSYPGDPMGSAGNIIFCLTNWRTPILTSNGWKPVKDIKKGDKVLTHKNRFKKVLRTLHRSYKGQVTTINTSSKSIIVTSGHKFLMGNGEWKEAQSISKGDNIQLLGSYCIRCGKPTPYNKKYCSRTCLSKDITDRQWANKSHRKNISRKAKAQLKREYKNGTRDKYKITIKARQANEDKYGKGGYLGKVSATSKHRKLIRDAIDKKYGSTLEMLKLKVFPALGRVGKGNNMSSIEKAMKVFLENHKKEYIYQFIVGRRRIDFYIEAEKLFIEVDGYPFHQDLKEERKRDLEILMQYPDHRISHVTYKTNPPFWDFYDLERLNHTGTFSQVSVRVDSVSHRQLKNNIRVYNFSVEDDESYIAKGFVNHNCRCVLLYHAAKKTVIPVSKPLSTIISKEIYKEFNDADDIAKWEAKDSKRWVNKITSDEKQSLRSYKGDGYLQINGYLRNPEHYKEELTKKQIKFIENHISNLQSVSNKSGSTKENMMVYRGVSNFTHNWNKAVGIELQDKGFMSTTLLKDDAIDFLKYVSNRKEMTKADVLIRLKVPKGSKGFFLDGIRPGEKHLENEYLLNSATKYKINKVSIVKAPGKLKGEITLLDCEVIKSKPIMKLKSKSIRKKK